MDNITVKSFSSAVAFSTVALNKRGSKRGPEYPGKNTRPIF